MTGASPKLAKYLDSRKPACSRDGFVEDSAWLQVPGAAASKSLFRRCLLECGQACSADAKGDIDAISMWAGHPLAPIQHGTVDVPRCLLRVKRVGFVMSAACPVYPKQMG